MKGGDTTIDIHRSEVNKAKAVKWVEDNFRLSNDRIIYFGDEFHEGGNDLPVARAKDSERPGVIVHVGRKIAPEDVQPGIIWDRNGSVGTLNHLRVLTQSSLALTVG